MDKLTVICLQRPVATLMAVGACVLLGLIAISQVPIGLLPATGFPGLTLETNYPGVGPEKVEQFLTRPLEEAISAVGSIVELTSTSEEGKSRIDIEFARGTDLRLRGLEIRERIEPVTARFPREVRNTTLVEYDPEKNPVFIAIFDSGEKDRTAVRETLESYVKKDLESLSEAGEILMAGGLMREVQVMCDRDALRVRRLQLSHVLKELQERNVNRQIGSVFLNQRSHPLQVYARFSNLDEIAETRIGNAKSGIIHLSDVCRVQFGFREQESAARLNGEERVGIYVYRAGGSDLLRLSRHVRAILNNSTGNIPYSIIYDQGGTIADALRNIFLATSAGIVALFVLSSAIFKNVQMALIVTGVIPINMLTTLLIFFLTGQELNIVTISGFLISAGLVAYIGILMLQSLQNFEISKALQMLHEPCLGLLCVLVALFLPLFFAPEEVRVFYGTMAAAMVMTISSGVLLCFTLLPVLHNICVQSSPAVFLRLPWAVASGKNIRISVEEKTRVLIFLLYGLLRFLAGRHRLHVTTTVVLILAGITAYSASDAVLVAPISQHQLRAQIEFPSGTTFGTTNATSLAIEKKLLNAAGVQQISSRVENARATLNIKLKPDQEPGAEYIDYLQEVAGKNDPAQVFFAEEGAASLIQQFVFHVMGDNLDRLDRITRELAKQGQEFPGVYSSILRYKGPRPELNLHVDNARAGRAGLSAAEIGDALRLAIQGGVATKVILNEREIDVRIRLEEKYRTRLEDLADFFLQTAQGPTPALELLRQEEGQVPVKIYRRQKKRSLSFALQATAKGVTPLMGSLDRLYSYPLPTNYRVEPGKEIHTYFETRRALILVGISGIILAYMVLAAYFESFRTPFKLFASVPIPLSILGLLLYLLRIDLSLSIIMGIMVTAMISLFQLLVLWKAKEGQRFRNGRTSRFLYSILLSGAVKTALFFLPLTLIFGEGGQITRSIALTVIAGCLISACTAPLFFGMARPPQKTTVVP